MGIPIGRWLHGLARRLAAGLVVAAVGAAPALAQDDPPGRVGRLAELDGGVSSYDADEGRWTDAERNLPLTGGDRIATAPAGRAELRIGSTVLRLGGGSDVELLRLDDERVVLQLHAGSAALRVRSNEVAAEIELLTVEARLLPQRAGHYRVDRTGDVTLAAAWQGDLRVGDTPWLLAAGQRVELVRENRGANLRQTPARFADDDFAAWVLAADERDAAPTTALRHVSPEMTGAEDLDAHGQWQQHPEYGAVWFPIGVHAGWAPYRHGRWTWRGPWGWTWVDAAPWGFAPFHYGRWLHWRNRWGWAPGPYVARPVFAPALVGWVGGPGWGASVRIGGPPVGWVPLAPREVYRPHYRHSPAYVDRVNPGPRQPHGQPRHSRPDDGGRGDRPWVWNNQAVPGAVTVAPGDALQRRRPGDRAPFDVRETRTGPGTFVGPQRPGAAIVPPTPGSPPPGPPPATAPRGRDRGSDRPGGDHAGSDPGPEWRRAPRPEYRVGTRPGMGPDGSSVDPRPDASRRPGGRPDAGAEPAGGPSTAPSRGPSRGPFPGAFPDPFVRRDTTVRPPLPPGSAELPRPSVPPPAAPAQQARPAPEAPPALHTVQPAPRVAPVQPRAEPPAAQRPPAPRDEPRQSRPGRPDASQRAQMR